ncbi:MAG: ABC transporter permease [Paracoccus sp. (in: a-proteobacteria)]|uniref:ABC transporter permease n=1 Tax=Paracoccus sp. TaxID=267 RepID=UPI0026DFF824|nr:ABC transporter permease [Paracoccus sp. (in: a-proteobacteria)]MDO5621343.1 ABC transporter permease [Paracoccus sp. (in: a-proteobacteria)]
MAATQFGPEARSGLKLVAPPFIYALLMLAAPLLTIFAFSFMTDGYLVIIKEFTLGNYAQTLNDPVFWTVMGRSFWIALAVTVATVGLAFPVAYFISFMVPPERKALWIFLITIPFWTSYLVRVFLWKVILGYNGVINSGLINIGLIDEPLGFLLYNVNSIVVTLAHAYAPFAILPIFVALEKIDRSLLEAGRDLGESRPMTFWRVTLPLAMPGVVAAVLIVFIPTIGDYVTPTVIGGGKIPMIANLVQAQMLDIDNKPLGSAIAVTAMAITTVAALVFVLLNRRFLRARA